MKHMASAPLLSGVPFPPGVETFWNPIGTGEMQYLSGSALLLSQSLQSEFGSQTPSAWVLLELDFQSFSKIERSESPVSTFPSGNSSWSCDQRWGLWFAGILSTPYYLTLVHLNIGICNSGPLRTLVLASCSLHNNAWPNGQVGAGIQPIALLAKPCSGGSNLHKGILGTRSGLVSIPAISQLNRTVTATVTLISIKKLASRL